MRRLIFNSLDSSLRWNDGVGTGFQVYLSGGRASLDSSPVSGYEAGSGLK